MKSILACVLLFALSTASTAAPKRDALPERYSKWLNEEVVYIITEQERKAFRALASDGQRDKFEEEFWEIRNPVRGLENPYRKEHYDRIAYANAHFGHQSSTPGWMTDMGRTWILFGKPISQHPFVGYGQIYPLELWSYDNPGRTPSLPAFFNVLFYIPYDIGEYKFYRPFLDGPMKLVRGSQFNSNADVYRFLLPLGGDLAHAILSLVPGDPIDKQTFRPEMSSDMLIGKIQNLANDHFNVDHLRTTRSMRTFVTSRVLVNGKDLTLSTVVLTDPLGEKWLDYCVPIDSEQMGLRTEDGQFSVNFHYRLMTESGALILEEEGLRRYPAYAHSAAFSPFQIAGRIPAVPGKYKLDVQVVNDQTKHSYYGEVSVSVPANGKETWLTGPLLSDSVSSAAPPNAAVPYQYFGAQFHPLMHADFPAAGKLRVLFQVYQPQPVDCAVEYIFANVLLRDARVVVTDHIRAADFQNNLLLNSKSLDTATLPPGEYLLAIQLKSAQGPVISSINQRLRIVSNPPEASLYFQTDPQRLARPGLVDYMRGLSAGAQGDEVSAQNYLEKSLRRYSGNSFAKQFLVGAYYRQHKYKAVSDLYRRGPSKDFDASPESLVEIAVSLWDTGDIKEARSVLANARGLFPDDTVLVAADKLFSSARN